MKHYKWIHDPINNTGTQQMKPKLSVFMLLAGMLLSLPFVGCGLLMPEGAYEAPQLPKSELAIIKIDTEGGWIHRYSLIALRIDGKLAVSKNIKGHEEISIGEILVVPGKHDMSVSTVHNTFTDEGRPNVIQAVSNFSADVKAGSTYLLKDEGELVDANTNRVVSESKFLIDQTAFEMER